MTGFEIILGKGLKDISFGDKENKIIDVYGVPDEIENYKYSDNTISKTLKYFKLDISFSLSSEENYRLTDILIFNHQYHISDKIKIGIDLAKLIEIADELDFGDYKTEEFHTNDCPTHDLISFDKINTNFWFDSEKLSSIQFGPLWIDDNTIKWIN